MPPLPFATVPAGAGRRDSTAADRVHRVHDTTRARPRAPNQSPSSNGPATDAAGGRWAPWVWITLTLIGSVVVGALFLSIYPSKGFQFAVGSDVPTYIWRSKLVASAGVDGLAEADQYPFRSNSSNPGRPGYPVLSVLVKATTGVSFWRLPFVIPAVTALAMVLAASVLAVSAAGEPRWASLPYGLAVGTWVGVAITAFGYLDNMLVDALVLAIAATALLAANGRPTILATWVLLAGAAIVHWQFTALFAVLLGVLALLLIPESVRSGRRLRDTPSARLAVAVAGGAALGAGALLLTPSLGDLGSNTREQYESNLSNQVPYYALPVIGPIAAAGAIALGIQKDRRKRRAAALFVLWAATAAVAFLAFQAGANVPVQRVLGFALGIPMLVAAAIVAGAAIILQALRGSPRRVLFGRAIAALLTACLIAGLGFLGFRAWYRTVPFEKARTFEQIGEAASYLRSLPDRPVIFAVSKPSKESGDFGLISALRRLRAQAPADRVGNIYVYLGPPKQLLAARPSVFRRSGSFNRRSLQYWQVTREVIGQNPSILVSRPFYRRFGQLARQHPEWRVSGDLLAVRGPRPTVSLPLVRAPTPPTWASLTGAAGAVLGLLLFAGLGWSLALVPGQGWDRLALSPSFGIAVLCLGGLLASKLGVGLTGWSGAEVAIGVALVGWLAFVPRALRSRRQALIQPATPSEDGA